MIFWHSALRVLQIKHPVMFPVTDIVFNRLGQRRGVMVGQPTTNLTCPRLTDLTLSHQYKPMDLDFCWLRSTASREISLLKTNVQWQDLDIQLLSGWAECTFSTFIKWHKSLLSSWEKTTNGRKFQMWNTNSYILSAALVVGLCHEHGGFMSLSRNNCLPQII